MTSIMKKIKNYLLALFIISATSCGENFLEEKPLDFLSTENAFQTAADFNASMNSLYSYVRGVFWNYNDNDPMDYTYRTDITFSIHIAPNLESEFAPQALIPARN